jgi:Holliday junction resolvasome RuvABC endonuclease subunit
MLFLALDLGTKTGWAIGSSPIGVISGTQKFDPGRFEGGGMRYLRFRRWLDEVKTTAGAIDTIYFEDVRRHLSTDSAHAYGGFMAHLTAWCEENKVPYSGVPVQTIKKFITGKGNANKEAVIEAVKSRGFDPKDDNTADAIALLLYAFESIAA